MSREEKEPTVTQSRIGACDEHDVFNHDAYATITMTTTTGVCGSLFGSDLGHNQRIHISIQRAHLNRNLSRDWIHGECMPIIDFEMSHSQFAQFITSGGNGSGTPITLRYAPPVGTKTDAMPMLKNIETKHETFRREIKESASKQIEHVRSEITRLGEMIESGKVGKKELRDLHQTLKCHAENLPGNISFVVKSAEEALEKATHDAKIEVEAYVNATAHRLGLESISELAKLENKS